MVFPGNDPIIVAFENNFEPIDLIHDHHKKRVQTVSTSLSTFIEKLSPSIIFPIPYDNSLIGLLVLNIGTRILDSEDIEFIKVFTESIGSTYYKDYLMQTTIENSQFQSFNQVVSFVVHDIKNQIATLSLLAKNADNYIDNIDFQKSLIRSIRSSSENLTTLVDKLSTKRKGVTICVESQPILPILEKVLDNSIIAINKGMQVEWVRKESCVALIDSSALEQVLLNLVKNASEAMQSVGTIRLYCSPTHGEHADMIKRFNLPLSALQAKSAIIIVEDTGCGMDKDFIETKLFKPFETTKDKGIGIGLYQCKTYVEKMKGVLLCDSHLNRGTAFCILL
jgi:signal transduction histidine kinase